MVEIKITREFALEVSCARCHTPLVCEWEDVNNRLLVSACDRCDKDSYMVGFSDGKFEARRG